MANYFVPYSGDSPVAVLVKGHRLIIVSRAESSLEENMDALGADNVRRIKVGNSTQDENQILGNLAKTVNAGVVVAPPNQPLDVILKSLENQLPWLH